MLPPSPQFPYAASFACDLAEASGDPARKAETRKAMDRALDEYNRQWERYERDIRLMPKRLGLMIFAITVVFFFMLWKFA